MNDGQITEALFTAAQRCLKRLWLQQHEPGTAFPRPAPVGVERPRLRQMARQFLPAGANISGDTLDQRIQATQVALVNRTPVYGATFQFQGCTAQAEILLPGADDSWELGAVSDALRVTSSQLERLAFQAYVASGAGLSLRRVWAWHVSSQYVRHGSVDPRHLLVSEEVTRAVSTLCHALEENLGEYAATLRRPAPPEPGIGLHCESPYDCPFQARCWAHLPEHNIFHLHKIRREQAFVMARGGQVNLHLLPEKMRRTRHRQIQLAAVAAGRAQVDRAAINQFLQRLVYPLYCLDFETIAAAIPPFDGMRPYEMLPVQYSLHTVAEPDAAPEHESFLSDAHTDPRPEILARLRERLGTVGSILAYNARFEQTVLRGLCAGRAEDEAWCNALQPRFLDVLSPFKAFAFYHPAQKGRVSLKAVMPAVTGRGYDDLAIREGSAASQEYVRVTFGDVPAEERELIRAQLEAYCGRDTEGLVWIIQALRSQATR